MGFSGCFGTAPVQHPAFGTLQHTRRRWGGTLELELRVHTHNPSWLRTAAAVAALAAAIACRSPQQSAPPDTYTRARMEVVIDGPIEYIYGARVTPAFFAAGQPAPLLGRFFAEPEYGEGGATVAVLSYPWWTQRLGGDPAVIGKVLTVDGQRRTIVGVARPEFAPEGSGSLWIPESRWPPERYLSPRAATG